MKHKKLTVGDINAFDRYRKDERRQELISITRELYGDSIPEGEVPRIEREIQKTQGLEAKPSMTLDEIIFLLWRSMLKSDPDISLKEAGEHLKINDDDIGDLLSSVLPTDNKIPTKAKKKTVRKKKKKNN